MDRKGFVSSIFLWYLLFTLSIVGVIEHQFQSKIRVYLNMQTAYKTLAVEIKIMDWLFCESRNKRLTSGTFTVDDISFDVEIHSEVFKVVIQGDSLKSREYDADLFLNNDK